LTIATLIIVETRDFDERRAATRPPPIIIQFGAMRQCPLLHEARRVRGQMTFDDLAPAWRTSQSSGWLPAIERDCRRLTGDHRYFVRAIHALGESLIDGGGDQMQARAKEAQALAREGLTWDPYTEAAQRVELWLRNSHAIDKEPAIDGLRTALRPILHVIEGGRTIKDAINETRETVIGALHDANEAALGETFLAA